jgi:ornithine cyclodeaminase/alanine dehydrogenase-like protein (mu-crystallin family)
MEFISAQEIERLIDYPSLIAAIEEAFKSGVTAPARHHHAVQKPGASDITLLLMPAWSDFSKLTGDTNGYIGVKMVTVAPDNGVLEKPAIMGAYLLLNGKTGEPQAIIDGPALTAFRTAATSALAARFLAREDAATHLVIGAGALSVPLARAHRAVRPIRKTLFWNRTHSGALAAAEKLRQYGFDAEAIQELDAGLRQADLISSATLSNTPLVRGNLLKPGTHVDLVGAFNAQMRESDDTTMLRSRIYVDTYAGALKEGGDIAQPITDGIISVGDIAGEMAELVKGDVQGRRTHGEITLFKSVGAALEDLAAGILIHKRFQAQKRAF